MIATLRPCSSCRRHVRYSETTCPFCAASLDRADPPRLPDLSRLSRAAQLAAGALFLAACGGDPKAGPVAPEPPVNDAGAGESSGDVVAMYGAPAEPPPPEAEQPPAPQEPGPARPLYGMPPPPK